MACRCFSVTVGSSSVLNVNFQMLRLCACGKHAGLTIRLESWRWAQRALGGSVFLLNPHRRSKCCRISLNALSSKVSKISRCYRGSVTIKEVYLCSRRMEACLSYLRMSGLQKEFFAESAEHPPLKFRLLLHSWKMSSPKSLVCFDSCGPNLAAAL